MTKKEIQDGREIKMKKGLFITFEGVEGSGKSTQIQKAAAFLRRRGVPVLVLREPGGTTISEAIREILLDRKNNGMFPEPELLLYLAARAQILREKIFPALEKGTTVICDRFEDSTLAYQGFGRKMPIDSIREVSRLFARGNLVPDLTILLNIGTKEGMKRGGRHDRMERESYLFHQKVHKGFLSLAKREPRRFAVIDSRLSIETVAGKVKEAFDRVL